LDLRSDTDGYSGEFSRPFFVTTSKLLVRTTRLDALYSHPEALRIGVLKSPEGKPPVTTSVIEEIFPTARIVGLSSRTEAVERLELGMALPDAIDAYAADEVLLDDILNHDIPADMRGEYSIEPPIHGYSREEYVVVVYNAPQLTAKVNAWLATPAGKAAAAQLVVETDAMAQGLHWLARGDHLAVARLLSNWLAFAGFVVLVLLLWRRRKRVAVAGEPEPVPLFPAIPSNPDEMSGRALLTARETEVLILLIKGNSSKETARDLDLSPRTVEAHRKNIYTKLGANTPLELVEYARKQGLV
jgi:DNA-binding CsgD family transcriptional regulator